MSPQTSTSCSPGTKYMWMPVVVPGQPTFLEEEQPPRLIAHYAYVITVNKEPFQTTE